MFSNSVDSTAGKFICKVPGGSSVADVAVISIGDCILLVEHPEFSAARAAHPVLFGVSKTLTCSGRNVYLRSLSRNITKFCYFDCLGTFSSICSLADAHLSLEETSSVAT